MGRIFKLGWPLMQVVTCLQQTFFFDRADKGEGVAQSFELENAFDAAIDLARSAIDAAMVALSGKPARPQLEALIRELELERARSVARGAVDTEWFQKTVRWVVEWAPETDLTLIAALGRISRVSPKTVS
jgi:hypothetical protein